MLSVELLSRGHPGGRGTVIGCHVAQAADSAKVSPFPSGGPQDPCPQTTLLPEVGCPVVLPLVRVDTQQGWWKVEVPQPLGSGGLSYPCLPSLETGTESAGNCALCSCLLASRPLGSWHPRLADCDYGALACPDPLWGRASGSAPRHGLCLSLLGPGLGCRIASVRGWQADPGSLFQGWRHRPGFVIGQTWA